MLSAQCLAAKWHVMLPNLGWDEYAALRQSCSERGIRLRNGLGALMDDGTVVLPRKLQPTDLSVDSDHDR
jgi:hypothetical protein